MYLEALTAKSPMDLIDIAKRDGKHPISYSQFSLYSSCPFAWKLKYIDKIKDESGSINMLFGSAVHTVLQEYLTVLFNKTAPIADEINLEQRLMEEMKKEYEKTYNNLPDDKKDFTSQTEMNQFYNQGIEILYFIKKHRNKYFPKKGWELVGVEVPLIIDTDSNENVLFIGFLDLVFREPATNTYKIIDIKTSTMGWNKYAVSDVLKNAQVVLYKKYYAKQLEIDPKQIDVEFLILRRIIYEKAEFPMSRVQRHAPAHGTPTMNKIQKMLDVFINVFDVNGNVKEDNTYQKNPGKSCKYCYYGAYNFCDKNKING